VKAHHSRAGACRSQTRDVAAALVAATLALAAAPQASAVPIAAAVRSVVPATADARVHSHVRRPVPRVRSARFFCRLPAGTAHLSASRVRGLARHLRQYPTIRLATRSERRAARALLLRTRAAAARLQSPAAAARAGYDVRRARRSSTDTRPHYLHAESRTYSHDGRLLDPLRPESLIYANVPGRRLVLIGVMFSLPRGTRLRPPAGPIARWHFHRVCARGNNRGVTPRGDGTCRPGATLGEGSEMLHVWFVSDLQNAFAIRAPVPELCRDRLLPTRSCARGLRLAGM
jgi:hypothetical protein